MLWTLVFLLVYCLYRGNQRDFGCNPRLDLLNTAIGVAFSVNASKIINVYAVSKRLMK